ncbi:MAG: hypothetical protein V2I33_17800, partial [Kangiellaceae bacterium]|nr:hypothetical protein [Kangiellaceae bacterium]
MAVLRVFSSPGFTLDKARPKFRRIALKKVSLTYAFAAWQNCRRGVLCNCSIGLSWDQDSAASDRASAAHGKPEERFFGKKTKSSGALLLPLAPVIAAASLLLPDAAAQ